MIDNTYPFDQTKTSSYRFTSNLLTLIYACCKKTYFTYQKTQKADSTCCRGYSTFMPAEYNPFPEKLKMAEEILSRTKFLDR